MEIRAGDKLVIFDGGTGLRPFGDTLTSQKGLHASMFFSHVHWDHIQGFPFFKPAFVKENHFDLYGGKNLTGTLGETLAGQMNFPNFPLTLEKMAASMVFHAFNDGQLVDLGDGVTVKALSLNHPNGCYGYRLEYEGKSVTYCTDTEHREKTDSNVLELASNADLFVYDAQYTPEEYLGQTGVAPKTGWGHSTYEVGAAIAKEAGVKRLVLFHHDPTHNDEMVFSIANRCRELFNATDAAQEGLQYEL